MYKTVVLIWNVLGDLTITINNVEHALCRCTIAKHINFPLSNIVSFHLINLDLSLH